MKDEVARHYDEQAEVDRLSEGAGAIELARTQEIVLRHLPPAPATVLDVGGGPGRYARWLTARGYRVVLVDPVAKHVRQALEVSPDGPPPAEAHVGDARALAQPDACADAVLMLGPLYHLTERADRVRALAEARRVVKPGGPVIAAAISRFASTLDGLASLHLDDPAFAAIAREDLATGQHRNPTDHPHWFTTAYFHRPEELALEVADAGLAHVETLPVEGPAWLLGNLAAHAESAERRDRLLAALRALEREPSLLGASAHLLAIGRRA